MEALIPTNFQDIAPQLVSIQIRVVFIKLFPDFQVAQQIGQLEINYDALRRPILIHDDYRLVLEGDWRLGVPRGTVPLWIVNPDIGDQVRWQVVLADVDERLLGVPVDHAPQVHKEYLILHGHCIESIVLEKLQ